MIKIWCCNMRSSYKMDYLNIYVTSGQLHFMILVFSKLVTVLFCSHITFYFLLAHVPCVPRLFLVVLWFVFITLVFSLSFIFVGCPFWSLDFRFWIWDLSALRLTFCPFTCSHLSCVWVHFLRNVALPILRKFVWQDHKVSWLTSYWSKLEFTSLVFTRILPFQ